MEAYAIAVGASYGFDAIPRPEYIADVLDTNVFRIQVLSATSVTDVVHTAFTREDVLEELHTQRAVVPEFLLVFSFRSMNEREA